VGGIDIVCELIENDEFDEMIPKECKKLDPKDALAELVATNPVILFVTNAENEENKKVAEVFGQIGL